MPTSRPVTALICVRTSRYLPKFRRGRGAALEQYALMRYGYPAASILLPDVLDFEKPEHDVDQRNHPEAERGD